MQFFPTATEVIQLGDSHWKRHSNRPSNLPDDDAFIFPMTTTVNKVLAVMAPTIGCDPSVLGLHFAGRWLRGDRSLGEEGVCALSTVHVLARLLGGMHAPEEHVRK